MEYQEVNGTYYHKDTAPEMVKLLEEIRTRGLRCRYHWGDVKTGQDWGDDYGVRGKIGRSTGSIKIPLLVYNERSLGGGALLDNCIVKITTTLGGGIIYQHPQYKEAK